jgi:CRISPR-associated protein Cas1
MLNEFVYCPRLFHIEFVQGSFVDSADTIEGRMKHARVDQERGSLPEPPVEGQVQCTSLMIGSERLGAVARIDLVEGEGGEVWPIDYKKGRSPGISAWPPDIVQSMVQAMLLRENGYSCSKGVIYYIGNKQRVEIALDAEMERSVLAAIEGARAVTAMEVPPPPLFDSQRCPGCSLVGLCLPDETNMLVGRGDEVRRLYPARDDLIPLYVQEQGAVVGRAGEEAEVRKSGEVLARVKLMELSQLSLYGNVQVTTQLLHELCEREIPICYFSYGGWFYGVTRGMEHKNVELRMRQYAACSDDVTRAPIASAIIEGKVRNCRTMLRRNCDEQNANALAALNELAGRASSCRDPEELLGIEGSAARVYFMEFNKMIKADGWSHLAFEERNRRPPRDPINAMLSYLYAILAKDAMVTALTVGLDPYIGFLHRTKYGKPAMALDLMEEFRPLVADSTVISVMNNREVGPEDFVVRGTSAAMKDGARKTLIRAYERRMDTLIRHPLFGYTVSYRRIMEVQARLICRWLIGEVQKYPSFCTR